MSPLKKEFLEFKERMIRVFFRKRKKEEKGRKDKNQEPATREQTMNDPNMPESVRCNLKEQDKKIKKQDEQINALRKAEEFGNEGKIDEAISIAEKVMYEEGLLVKGAKWPYILSDLYLKKNMHNECWKYLNFLTPKLPNDQDKICEIRTKILKKEGKHSEALYMKMSALLYKYTAIENKPTEEKIQKDLKPLIKKADLLDKENEILALVNKHLRTSKFNANQLKDELKAVFK